MSGANKTLDMTSENSTYSSHSFLGLPLSQNPSVIHPLPFSPQATDSGEGSMESVKQTAVLRNVCTLHVLQASGIDIYLLFLVISNEKKMDHKGLRENSLW